MTEYKGNLKVGDYIKVITDKSKYFEDECKILYFTSQNRIAVRVVNPSKIDEHKGKKFLISIKSVKLYCRVCDAYTKILPQKELCILLISWFLLQNQDCSNNICVFEPTASSAYMNLP